MRKIVFFFALLMTFPCVSSAVDFYEALALVESGGNPSAVGDGGRSVGLYQIGRIYVDDVNRIAGSNFTYADRYDPGKSRRMVEIYIAYYGRRYTRLTGCPATFEVLAAIHNGGPDGWKKPATRKHWRKMFEIMKSGSDLK